MNKFKCLQTLDPSVQYAQCTSSRLKTKCEGQRWCHQLICFLMLFWEMSRCLHSLWIFTHLKLDRVVYFLVCYWVFITVQCVFLIMVQDYTGKEVFSQTVRIQINVWPVFSIRCLPIRQVISDWKQLSNSVIVFVVKLEKNVFWKKVLSIFFSDNFYILLLQLAKRGLNVVMISRTLEKLQRVATEIGKRSSQTYFPV